MAASFLPFPTRLMADAILDGLAAGQAAAGVDLGASEAPMEPALARSDAAPAEAASEEAAG